MYLRVFDIIFVIFKICVELKEIKILDIIFIIYKIICHFLFIYSFFLYTYFKMLIYTLYQCKIILLLVILNDYLEQLLSTIFLIECYRSFKVQLEKSLTSFH